MISGGMKIKSCRPYEECGPVPDIVLVATGQCQSSSSGGSPLEATGPAVPPGSSPEPEGVMIVRRLEQHGRAFIVVPLTCLRHKETATVSCRKNKEKA